MSFLDQAKNEWIMMFNSVSEELGDIASEAGLDYRGSQEYSSQGPVKAKPPGEFGRNFMSGWRSVRHPNERFGPWRGHGGRHCGPEFDNFGPGPENDRRGPGPEYC